MKAFPMKPVFKRISLPHSIWMCVGMLVALLIGSAKVKAAPTYYHISSTMDGMGGVSTNTVLMGGVAYRHIGAGAQAGGIHSSTGGGTNNRAGFLQAMEVRRPDLDHDTNGVPDELDWDNDGDGLADLSEADGSAFQGFAITDLNHVDTDGDGMSDFAESELMFDPLDPNHRLIILSLDAATDSKTLRWIGKGGDTTNQLFFSTNLIHDPFGTLLSGQTYPGGIAPWYKMTNEYNWIKTGGPLFYRVEMSP